MLSAGRGVLCSLLLNRVSLQLFFGRANDDSAALLTHELVLEIPSYAHLTALIRTLWPFRFCLDEQRAELGCQPEMVSHVEFKVPGLVAETPSHVVNCEAFVGHVDGDVVSNFANTGGSFENLANCVGSHVLSL